MPQLSPSYYWLSTASLQWAKFDLVLLEHPLFTETIASPYTTLSRSLSLLYWIAQSLPNTVTVQHCKIVINIVPEGLWEQCVWSEHHFTTHTLIGVITMLPPITVYYRELIIIIHGLTWVMMLTSILSDVSYPWERLVSTLLNDLQITHLFKIINK